MTFLELRASIITIIMIVIVNHLWFTRPCGRPQPVCQCRAMCEVDATQGARVVAV